MNRFKAIILAYTAVAENYCKINGYLQEDSIVNSPDYNQRVIYINADIKDKELLKFDIIKLSTPFWFDNGTKYIPVTHENYTDFDFTKILTEKTDKYDIDII